MLQQWPDDPAANALTGLLYAVLIEAGVVALVMLVYWPF
jgi:hypothetical protein